MGSKRPTQSSIMWPTQPAESESYVKESSSRLAINEPRHRHRHVLTILHELDQKVSPAVQDQIRH